MAENAGRAVGIDPDRRIIRSASRTNRPKNLSFSVGRGEQLGFAADAFDTVIFCQSLHHVPDPLQKTALAEAHRVVRPGGRVLVIEPVPGEGTFDAICSIFHDEAASLHHARETVVSAIPALFALQTETRVSVEDTCSGFNDFYENHIAGRTYYRWEAGMETRVADLLDGCRKTAGHEMILDYTVAVWLLEKSRR